jgi:AraC-like DNA-binding protein
MSPDRVRADPAVATATTRRSAHPRLRHLVPRNHVAFSQASTADSRWLEPPRAAVTLMLGIDGSIGATAGVLPDAWIAGIADQVDVVEIRGAYASLDLKLTPLGAYTIVGMPLTELSGTVGALDDVLGSEALLLMDQVREAPDWETRFDLAETFLLRRADAGPEPSPAVAWAWSRLAVAHGLVSIGALAAELGWSRRHLATTFREQVGMPPKTIARLLRFQRVEQLLDADPVRWADIAQECGYADQSHLIRDFHDLAGTTPTDYVARRLARSAAQVTFVQDGTLACR